MSVVTDILLRTVVEVGRSGEDHRPNADALSAWLVGHRGSASTLKKLDDFAGGDTVSFITLYTDGRLPVLNPTR